MPSPLRGAAWKDALEQGSAMVETAVAFPLLIMVAVTLVQFALYVHAENVVIGSVQDGARVAAEDGRSLDEGLAHTRALLQAGLGPTAANVSVTGAEGVDAVVVEAQGGLSAIIPWAGGGMLPLRARAVMSKERFRGGPGG